jgi:hypothetical protein
MRGADGPLYTLQAGDTTYEVVPNSTPLHPGVGCWAHFSHDTPVIIVDLVNPQPMAITLPAGQFILIGNPFGRVSTIAGADVVYTYDPTSGQYQQTSTLQRGQGAWAYSADGGAVAIEPVSP